MKFSNLAVVALAAAVQATPEPQQDIINQVSTFVDGAVSRAETFVNGAASTVANAYSDGRSAGTKLVGDASSFVATRTAQLGSDIARASSEALAKASSISQRLATETDVSVRSSISAELSKVTESVARATSSVASRATDSPGAGAHGPGPTAAVAMGALMGGAAMFANF
ncbi:hypothetical protein HRG_006102 [Hirsutella rhossiliensis]|uniref:Cell wall protein n=1 Tax=Hirsutella rhossiliensis TaxID=111463 RepID=A0A9P8MZ10_9HYPO|nr:uncharacterized protein HRG_06102 [Hirsutella rhossiliensis]KAH0963592.1 hypothetical protein HRG_06102 [Hirsutella rhossiliensis]